MKIVDLPENEFLVLTNKKKIFFFWKIGLLRPKKARFWQKLDFRENGLTWFSRWTAVLTYIWLCGRVLQLDGITNFCKYFLYLRFLLIVFVSYVTFPCLPLSYILLLGWQCREAFRSLLSWLNVITATRPLKLIVV